MSKLIELLERTNRLASPRLGFGPAAREEKPPAMVLLGVVTSVEKARQAKGVQVDGVLLASPAPKTKALEGLGVALESRFWGLHLHALTVEEAKAYRDKGVDFLVVEAPSTPLDALQEDTGRVLAIGPDLDEEQAQAIEALPLDAVLLTAPQGTPMKLQHLMALGALRGLIGKPFIIILEGVPSSWELECLRDISINGIVMDLEKVTPSDVAEVRKRLVEMPRPKPRKERAMPLLPSAPVPSEPEEEDRAPFPPT